MQIFIFDPINLIQLIHYKKKPFYRCIGPEKLDQVVDQVDQEDQQKMCFLGGWIKWIT